VSGWFHKILGIDSSPRSSRIEPGSQATVRSFEELKRLIHSKLVEKLDLSRVSDLEGDTLRLEIRLVVERLCDTENPLLNRMERERAIDEVLDETFGFGPLEVLLKDPTILAIQIHDAHDLRVRRQQGLERTEVKFRDSDHLKGALDRVSSRLVDGVLGNCFEVDLQAEPRIPGFPLVVIRRLVEEKERVYRLPEEPDLDLVGGTAIRFREVTRRLRQKLVDRLDLSRRSSAERETLRPKARTLLQLLCMKENLLDDPSSMRGRLVLDDAQHKRLIDAVLDEAFGFGPLQVLLGDPTVRAIALYKGRSIKVRTADDWLECPDLLPTTDSLQAAIAQLGARSEILLRDHGFHIEDALHRGDDLPGAPLLVLRRVAPADSDEKRRAGGGRPLSGESQEAAASRSPLPPRPLPPGAATQRAVEVPEPARRMPAEQAPAVWQVGQVVLDLYEVLDIHSGGGMGLVYRVRHRGWGLDLAVKTLRPELLASEQDKADFEREAETWVKLGLHPHTVTCHYVRRLGGTPRLFAEYVEGGSLAEWVRTGQLYQGGAESALARVLDVAIQIAWGLQHAHEQGLVHQDVKPGNVLMAEDGTAKVTDFGLARAVRDRSRLGPAGKSALVSAGGLTPAYCSPEQAGGHRLNAKTDIWSWGLSVLEMFTGAPTWRQGQVAPEALDDYLRQPPHDTRPTMPAGLADLLRRCFREGPADRPANVVEIVAALREVYRQAVGHDYPRLTPRPAQALADGLNNRAVSLIDLGKQAEAEGLWREALKIDPRHLESSANLGLLQWRAGQLAGEALLQRLGAVGQAHPDHWLIPLLVARVLLEQGEGQAALKALDQIAGQDADRPEVRQARAAAQHSRQGAGRPARTFTGHTGPIVALSACGTGTRFLSASAQGDPYLARWDTLRLWDAQTGQCLRNFDTDRGSIVAACLAADGNTAAVLGRFHDHAPATVRADQLIGNWKLLLWDTTTGIRRRSFSPAEEAVTALGYSGDGRLAWTGGRDGMLTQWDTAGTSAPRRWQAHQGAVAGIVASADGTVIVSAGADGLVKRWDTATGRCTSTFPAHEGPVTVLAGDVGLRVAMTGGGDGAVRFWDVGTGQCLHRSAGHGKAVTAVCLSPDGQHALSGAEDGVVRVWDVSGGRCLGTLDGQAVSVTALALACGGRVALSGSSDRTVREWSLQTLLQEKPVRDEGGHFVLCRVTSTEQ
jgi:serine/threonine protein kinase